MKQISRLISSAGIAGFAYFALSACSIAAGTLSTPDQSAPSTAGSEVLADGTVRDAAPSEHELNNFFALTKKNLVSLPAGSFEMGDWGALVNKDGLPFDGALDSKPLHKVTLSPFSIGKYPVTYAEFDMFTAAVRLPRINQDEVSEPHRKPNNPAGVTWQGAKDYCEWLAKETGEAFSIPTEAQWEYAARSGGKRHLYPTDNGQSEQGRNVPSYEQRKAAGGLVPVSSFPPNAAGLYYMGAGVHEWVSDWYANNYYEKSPVNNPTGPSTGTMRVTRGFAGSPDSATTINRWKLAPNDRTGTWTKYGQRVSDPNREIPITKYSNYRDSAFRCVRNSAVPSN